MRKSKFTAVVAAGLLAFSTLASPPAFAGLSSTPVSHGGHIPAGFWIIFGCAGNIIAAAWVANAVYHRQLTQAEAMTCGIGFWLNPNNKKP